MSKNKKLSILIVILVIVILGIISIFIYKSKKVDNVAIGESNTNQLQDNNTEQNIINEENGVENVETNNTIEENKIEQEQNIEESKPKQEVQEKSTQSSTKKENNATTTSQNKKTEEKTSSQESQQNVKNEQTTVTPNNNTGYTEQEVQIAPKTECVGNNHKISSGNTGKWFDSKAQAEAYFDTEIEKWGKMWENDEIEHEEYLKKCPYGYEVWTCPQCQKWTINFYYR